LPILLADEIGQLYRSSDVRFRVLVRDFTRSDKLHKHFVHFHSSSLYSFTAVMLEAVVWASTPACKNLLEQTQGFSVGCLAKLE